MLEYVLVFKFWARVCWNHNYDRGDWGFEIQTKIFCSTSRCLCKGNVWQKTGFKNSNIPTSVLNKSYNFICYHQVREAYDEGVIHVGWIKGDFDLVYLFKKTTIPVNTRNNLVG